jgi:hypothetical protein
MCLGISPLRARGNQGPGRGRWLVDPRQAELLEAVLVRMNPVVPRVLNWHPRAGRPGHGDHGHEHAVALWSRC